MGLKSLRVQQGWTQRDLARESGVRQDTISDIETRHRPNPRWSTVRALAEALGVSVYALMDESEPEASATARSSRSTAA